ncbi:hypothetical protein PVAG01_01649 [Phlyctema vagabunda]|uniref:Centrosomin N-terminal motif 1 domain-containing protein n=1 Tax=Phlyctema vagabunda TaxID=108571 RepID=A0ABR4PXP9_9HELO
MDDAIQPRRMHQNPRPESSSSRDPRMTPSNSSTNSAIHMNPSRQSQNQKEKAKDSGGSSMLQERLRERKVESARQRRRSVDVGLLEDRGVQSSPLKLSSREERRPSSSGVGAAPNKKIMGVKQIEEQVSTLHKQNFDLKLELYHRRERQEKLEARLEAVEARLAEQDELQEVNEELLIELEKRDQAVEEAVGIICDLEEKVERMMKEREIVQKFDAQQGSNYFSSSHQGAPRSSPPPFLELPETNGNDNGSRLPRMPSFLSEQSENTEALRSLYHATDRGHSGTSLPRLLEDVSAADGMSSPPLSLLSESSFLSIYGEKPLALDEPLDELSQSEESSPPKAQVKSPIEKRTRERPGREEKGSRPPAGSRSSSTRTTRLLSINSVLESPLQRLERGEHRLERLRIKLENGNQSLNSRPADRLERAPSAQEKRRSREIMRRLASDKDSFDRQQALPPTPDTVSTNTLRHYKNSHENLQDGHRQLDGSERSRSRNPNFAVPRATHHTYQSMISARPKSAGETITSRRDGHGWDTETQDDQTEIASLRSTASTFDTQDRDMIAPDMFNFGHAEEGRTWGRDVMFDHTSSNRLPAHRTQFCDDRQHLGIIEPHSDSTVTAETDYNPYNNRARQTSETSYDSNGHVDSSPRPSLPGRRSSLSTASKLKKAQPAFSHNRHDSQPSAVAPSPMKERKLARFTGLFGRSSTSPALNGKFGSQQSSSTSSGTKNSHDPAVGDIGLNVNGNRVDFAIGQPQVSSRVPFNDDEMERATPPPIARCRTSHQHVRPSSAGTGIARRNSAFSNSYGGRAWNERESMDVEPEAEPEEITTGKIGGRRWLGKLGRAGSLNKRGQQ